MYHLTMYVNRMSLMSSLYRCTMCKLLLEILSYLVLTVYAGVSYVPAISLPVTGVHRLYNIGVFVCKLSQQHVIWQDR